MSRDGYAAALDGVTNLSLFITFLPQHHRNEDFVARKLSELGLGCVASVAMTGTSAVVQFRWWYASRAAAALLQRLGGRHGKGKGENTVQLMINYRDFWNVTRYSGAHTHPPALSTALADTENAVQYMQSFLVQQLYFRHALALADADEQSTTNVALQKELLCAEVEHIRREIQRAEHDLALTSSSHVT